MHQYSVVDQQGGVTHVYSNPPDYINLEPGRRIGAHISLYHTTYTGPNIIDKTFNGEASLLHTKNDGEMIIIVYGTDYLQIRVEIDKLSQIAGTNLLTSPSRLALPDNIPNFWGRLRFLLTWVIRNGR